MPEIQEVLSRMWTDLLARPSGPFAFRFVLQPLMATILAIRDGITDARTGRSPYLWTVLRATTGRRGRLAEGLKATARIIVLGVVIDAAYQFSALAAFYPVEALVIALLLGFVPYLLIRGPVDRVAKWRIASREGDGNGDIEQAEHPRHLG